MMILSFIDIIFNQLCYFYKDCKNKSIYCIAALILLK